MMASMWMIVAGRVGDLFGRRKTFYFGFVIFTIATVGAGAAHTINELIFFRALHGMAAAIVFTLCASLLPQIFPKNEQMRAIRIYGACTGIGLAVRPFLGGILITLLNWRWVFWINIPIILVGLILCLFTLRESPKPEFTIKIDWMGLLLLTTGIGCLIYGIIHSESYAWSSPGTWLNLLIGVFALMLLFFVENKVDQPLLDFSIFKNKRVTLAALTCVMVGLVTFVLLFFDPLYFQSIRRDTAFVIGLLLFSVPVIQVFISIFLENLTKAFGARLRLELHSLTDFQPN